MHQSALHARGATDFWSHRIIDVVIDEGYIFP
jgi:hypothetical protein